MLRREDFCELKSLGKPPRGIDQVCAAAMQLLAGIDPRIEVDDAGGVKDLSWKASQKVLGNVQNFLEHLKSFRGLIGAGKVPQANIERARIIQREMGALFSEEHMAKKSHAVAGLVVWISSTISYYDELAAAVDQS